MASGAHDEPKPGAVRARGALLAVAALAAIAVASAAALRLAWPAQVDWDGDFALHTLRALELARGERVDVLVGFRTSAGGAHLPGLFHHLLALPALAGAGPVGLTAAVACTNVLAVLLLVTVGRRAFGLVPALAGGLLLAVLPAAALRARAIRNETLLVPLVVALLVTLERARRRPGSRAAGFAAAIAVAMVQLHLSAAFLLVPLAVPLLLALRRAGARASLPGLALAALLAAPYAAHELSRGFPEARAFVAGVGGQDAAPGREVGVHARATPLELAARAGDLLGTSGFAAYVGDAAWRDALDRLPAPVRLAVPVAAAGAQAAAALGLVLAAVGAAPARRAAHRRVALLTLAALGVYLLVGVRARQAYLFLLLPCLCLAAGVGLAWLLRAARRLPAPWPRPVRRGLLAGGLAGAALLAAATLAALGGLARAGGAPDARYGATYACKRAALDWLLEQGLGLGRYPSFAYPMTFDIAWRAAPPERQARYAPVATHVPFWGQPFLLPVPRGPLRTASLYEGAAPPGAAPAARFGPVVVVLDGGGGR
ncbi:MAG: glycosyltransferase family 39 protein [Planctomycetes bacterium]|nr:glycosyltransferase family 39 protein [Planctomycetota bacterium]